MTHTPVWVSKRDNGTSRVGIQKALQRILRGDGPNGAKPGPHLLRHTFATEYCRSGGNVRILQEILGHEDLETTWKPPGNHLETTWKPPGNHLETTWKPPGNHLETTWKPPGKPPGNHNGVCALSGPGCGRRPRATFAGRKACSWFFEREGRLMLYGRLPKLL